MSKKLFQYRLAANSLVEVIVALVILLFLFFIVIEFFTNVDQTSLTTGKMNAANALNEYIYQTEKQKTFGTAKEAINGWLVSREIQPYSSGDSLATITYTVYSNDSLLTPLLMKNKITSIKQ
jgi:type II secretory pathway pseudopilin PulG